ncbi:MFS transporter [Catellatospora methionotrophica]|uniref:MFS transporter n=1 Tax=Catellatospora methionotrophica TaxID=121620 RepID=A0A8J3LDV6_9ACTN|nr:MFS transporter [Catellatospora methionotrophica]GIG16453.1 MFS transporter [Catellatospora methionotrophica]
MTIAARTTPYQARHTASAPRWALSPTAAFTGAALAYASLYLAAGAPTPLLVLFQREWGFPASMLTVAFAAYAFALLAALLVAGSLSDHVGRRPVLVGALLVELVSMVMFVFAPNLGWVIAARVVQGLATGAASSAFTAALLELAPPRFRRWGGLIGSAAPAGGLGLGALLTGAAVQFTHSANVIVFSTLTVIMALGTVVLYLTAETSARRPGALGSLVPRVTVPHPARREFTAAVPVHLSAWMMAGLFMGLGPTIVRGVFHLDSGLVNGATAFLAPGAAAVAGVLTGRLHGRRATLLGTTGVLVGTLIVAAGIAGGLLPVVWLGAAVSGSGFGAAFGGALRLIGPHAQPHQRGGLFAAVFLVAYLSFGLPLIVAGQGVASLGLLPTVLTYSGIAVLVAAAGLLTQLRLGRRDARVPVAA